MTQGARSGRRILAIAVVLTAGLTGWAAPASASAWTVALAGTAISHAQAGALVAPTGATATCVSAATTTITVTWTAAAHATDYTVLESTSSATSGFAVVATGVTGTSWTSPSLADGSYWYEITTVDGNWSSPSPSSATAQRSIATGGCA